MGDFLDFSPHVSGNGASEQTEPGTLPPPPPRRIFQLQMVQLQTNFSKSYLEIQGPCYLPDAPFLQLCWLIQNTLEKASKVPSLGNTYWVGSVRDNLCGVHLGLFGEF